MVGRPGLYANIHAKRKRIAAGSKEKMRKKGAKGAPTAKAFTKHEKECSRRFADVEKKIDRLDQKLWGLAILIIIASGLEQLL